MRVFLIGAGQVGSTIVEALHEEHDITVLDTEASRLQALNARFDVAVFEGDGTSRKDLAAAGVGDVDLVIACTSRDEVNLVAGMFARREAEGATTVIRTSSIEYVELWREGQLDVDFVVSSELETAYAISRILGVPAARQTDVFADGQVQVGEFDVDEDASGDVLGVPLRHAPIPADSKVAAIIRTDETILPGGDDEIRTRRPDRRDRLAASRQGLERAALAGRRRSPRRRHLRRRPRRNGDRARAAHHRVSSVRMIEASREQALRAAEALPKARVFNATGFDPDFLERERIGQSQAGIFAMRDDAKNQYAATLARVHGIPFTIAIAHEAVSVGAFDQAGIDVSINPRAVTAEEIVRFAHDPRMQQVAMLEGNRYEVLDVTTRESSRYIGMAFRDMPVHGSIIGAIVRNGDAIFPHGDDVLQAGDRVIIFTEAANAPWVVEAL